MAATTMHFGPEWMRAKTQTPARHQPPPSPPPQPASAIHASTYSALVTPTTLESDRHDDSRPFRYTKDDLLRIYKEGGGRSGLNLEVERWEGIVRDVATEPAGLREMSDAERKLFAGPLNSELRRRQSTDLMNVLSSSPSDRQRLSHPNSASNNTIRYGPFTARRRDSTDQPPLALPRKLSISNTQGGALASPRDALPSPRNRMGVFSSGFDGVLNSGDSWSRRRPSLSVTGAGGGSYARNEGKDEDARRSEIKEEDGAGRHSANARHSDAVAAMDQSSSLGPPDTSLSDGTLDAQVSPSELDPTGQSMAGTTLGVQNQSDSDPRIPSVTNTLLSGPPPRLTDPASIEWSYLDPQGQVQGPFRADLMQKWFDEGYFNPTLLMKRTHIDPDWIAVGVLERRAAGEKIFLSQISNGPPGLAIHTESPKSYSPVHEQNVFNGYQPAPTRTLRTTLDAYLNGSSPTDSPSSSLGGGRFGNGSPDPSTFGSGTGSNVYSSDSIIGGRTFGGRAAFQDPTSDIRALNNNPMGRAPVIDTFNAYSAGGGVGGSPWSAGPGKTSQGFNDNEQHPYSNEFNAVNSLPTNQHFGDTTYSAMGSLGNHHDSPIARQPSDINGMPFNSNITNGPRSQFGVPTQFSQPPSVSYATSQHCQPVSPFKELLSSTSETLEIAQTPTSTVQPDGTSPWCPRSFEIPPVPSPVVPPAQQATEWITPQPTQPVGPSPWLIASLPVVDDLWKEMPGPNSLTFSNVGQHNKLQEQEEDEDVAVSPMEGNPSLSSNIQATQSELTNDVSANGLAVVVQSVIPAVVAGPSQTTQGPTVPKARRKSSTRDVPAPATKIVPLPNPALIKDKAQPSVPAPLAAQPKPAWAVEDESKKQKGSNVTSLREIQEAEVRKAEARKAAEKEREHLARASTVANGNFAVEEDQPLTSSWGLPISQAGARNIAQTKEASTTSSGTATPAAPVWTNATPATTAKKTMKEIQEEEEKRKKLAIRESMASATARRGYAETTVKIAPSTQATGGPWTTVGPSGKTNPPTTNIPRPTVNTSPNNSIPTTLRSNGTATRQATATTVKVVAPRIDDFPATPSHDFLKWLGESLKGLNSSVNLEEISSMLLSFPVDPDPSTIEIISDLIYASSTTLDGRRFASEYVNKRKVDAATRRGTTGASSTGGKPVSIADVVKAQPKPVQQEWGFKVVNKKKKGGRT